VLSLCYKIGIIHKYTNAVWGFRASYTEKKRTFSTSYNCKKQVALTKSITTHLPTTGCFTITRMYFLGRFDDKKQERKAQEIIEYSGKGEKIKQRISKS
jgi:hypothetical protein